ncbi:hydrogen peroxide-dependent heme synthase [Rathayibacter toxicus]|uniref:Coproheme decarboxylase n=1 Tax=Rathayibacter toxicus TaxID=145458 RepID=A0A2S5Y8D1_9MICO|nr:hydrogen peroxide-dependent heme synthase [Rathayibacter toxicus]PPG23010.1 chlorite dismutase [Rathayibacter toxicus]PPG47592.1 chlorite dismutase [Rathayibacter toxicus]PPH24733.1 chlorite dismutase [Rathayibacter toxicus]PPH58661.1 chlorite dismutase [Rathayibacter toxicus]PPH60653.1 chlorite dismutase [Rathayibacter toxicus]
MTDQTADRAGSVQPTLQTSAADPDSSDQTLGYALWAVLRRDPARSFTVSSDALESAVRQYEHIIDQLAADGVTLRGTYDVSALRADADLMLWFTGSVPEELQRAYRDLRRTDLLTGLLPTWNAMGVHRDAEFSADHLPAYLRGKAPARWLTVYPFVRSYEWYILPEDERRAMLAQHGRRGSRFRSVLTNTVASFSLGDYEWILALEDDELVNLVDLMRDLRATDARRHVREEVPFYTGRRIEAVQIAEVLR